MQSRESNAAVERTLGLLGYPSRVDRQDLWTKPRAALGVPNPELDCIQVLYWGGFPRAVVAFGTQPEVVLAYVTGPAFIQPPPVALVFDGSGNVRVFKRDGNQFHAAATAPVWKQMLSEPPGRISPVQATRVIQEVAEGNRNWFQDIRSKKVVGVLPRIFPEGTVILYELLQNAADSGASEAAFRLESDTLLFSHNGFPFTENDVDSISFVNSSTKPLDNIGFMGLGFKAAYEISNRPEIHSPPFCFRFDRHQEGGELLPIPTDCTHTSLESYSTFFRFPFKEQAMGLIAEELKRFDGRPLLYIGEDLRRITTPSGDFHLRQVRAVGQVRMLEVSESMTKSRTEYAVFSKELELSSAARQEFVRDRNLELSRLEGRKQQVSIAISLDRGIPEAARPGRLQVYLPTDVEFPLGFDVQGNFLVGASRKELRHVSGPWNREHFQALPMLVADVIEWAKSQAPNTPNWACWYDLIPDWQELEGRLGPPAAGGESNESAINLRSAFAAELSKRKLIPAVDNRGSLVFVATEYATTVDHDLQEVLSVSELARLSEARVISPDLSEIARDRLTGYIQTFGPTEFRVSLEGSAWVGRIDAFSESTASRQGRRQLAKILAYLARKRLKYPGDLGKCTIVLTQEGKLRAARDKGTRRVHTLPDVDISFPTQELVDHYDVVHQGFRRELNRPGEMNLDPSITRDAVRALELVAPTLGPARIAGDIILPLFRDERWQGVSDERLCRYTRFLMQHSSETRAAIGNSNFKVKVRDPSRQYLPPSQTYFGKEYSPRGARLDSLCANAEGVYFLSDDYLQSGGVKDEWVRFFAGLEVTSQPRMRTLTRQIPARKLDELQESTEEPQPTHMSLRASPIGGIKASHFALDNFELDSPILKVIQELYRVKPPGWKDRLFQFAAILDAGWAEYEKWLKKELRYAKLGHSTIERKRVKSLTTFARFLTDEPWLPVVDDLRTSMRPSELVLDTEENRRLASKDTPLSYCTFDEPSLISFLGIREHSPEATPLMRLRYAVRRKEDNHNVFEELYADLAKNPGLDMNALRVEFRDNALIFAPDHDPSYITSKEALYASRTVLGPCMAAIKDAYPNLEEFFTESLGVPTAENLEHFVEFLRDYVWKSHPPITDNLRSAVESCYRRFFNHLNETQDDARKEALTLLKEQLGSPTMVFCGDRGWIDTTKITVLYPDTTAYEGLLSDKPGIAIESHLKRLAQPLSEIRMLLDALNVRPVSEAIRREAEIGKVKSHSKSTEFGERLSRLVRTAVTIVEREQAKTESTSRNVSLFLQEWRRRSITLFENIQFLESPPLTVRDILVADSTSLREMQWESYVSANTDHLRIYMAGDLLEVFDAIADQLRDILRLDLLPAGLRDEIASLVQSNLARLGSEQFVDHLDQRLLEKGFPVEEDEELLRIEEEATRGIEAEAQAGPDEQVQEPKPETERPLHSTPDGGGGDSGTKERQDQLPPKAPTPKEILAGLPGFDESSYGSDRVVDLSGTSQWQFPNQQTGGRRGSGGGSGGGGDFRTAQARREAYGSRGEEWVVEQERRALEDAGRPDLAERVLHKSKTHEGSPWDIESFEKSDPYQAIYVEVKSTSDEDNFEVDMSVGQIRAALQSSHPYYLYRVVNVVTSKPTVYIYDFRKVSHQLQFSATSVSVTLPRPEEVQQ